MSRPVGSKLQRKLALFLKYKFTEPELDEMFDNSVDEYWVWVLRETSQEKEELERRVTSA